MTATAVLERIPDTVKLWGSVAAILATGFSGGVAVVGYAGLPARVEENERRLELVEETLYQIQRNIQLSTCLTIAEKAGRDWRECLRN